jgi:phosphate:Na+ symporter
MILGGIGLFLLGMVLLTDGLKTVAGNALRQVLARFVAGPWSAVASGAFITALVQSSSATTLTTIGFVSAGLITFPQAVGVVFGANIGTTSTAWLVSMLGLKFSISVVAMPAVGVGALMRLLGRDRTAALGLALAGFGLIFVGIDTLQSGMQSVAGRFELGGLRGETFVGRLLLVGIGAGMTVVMQSSSAAVATTLTALHAGAISLPQAAALTVGQNVGTTVTAALACIGGSVAAKRTAVAHILFNVITGVVAFIALGPFVALADSLADRISGGSDAVSIAAFHTAFNVLGVVLLAPWMRQFARLVARLVPERGPVLTRRLDSSVATIAPVAIEAVRRTLGDILLDLTSTLRTLLATGPNRMTTDTLARVAEALARTRHFMGLVRSDPETTSEHRRHLDMLHALDHIGRLHEACEDTAPPRIARGNPTLAGPIDGLLDALAQTDRWLRDHDSQAPVSRVTAIADSLAETRRSQRDDVLRDTATRDIEPDAAVAQLEAMRWIDRLAYHVGRTVHHMADTGEHNAVPVALPNDD